MVLDAQKSSRNGIPPKLVAGLGRVEPEFAGEAATGGGAGFVAVVSFGIIGLVAVQTAESEIR